MNLYKNISESVQDDELKIIDNFNQKLKNIKTFDEFKELEKEVFNSGLGLNFRTRKAKWSAFDFSDAGDGYVHYLLGDSVSTRKQKLSDLWKYLEISNNWR